MTLNEVRKVLENAAWTRETPLVELFDELVEHHDQPRSGETGALLSKITATCAGLTQPGLASGQVVARVLSLRQECGLAIYKVGYQGLK